jgi:asparagine synthase (glutamine-hydrolysing)
MCGICGIYQFESGFPVIYDEVQAMCQTLVHRGPDDEGIYVQGPIGLGMRRLSIIDIVGGKQPISNEDKTIWIAFNGEIYNYRELRKLLIEKGHCFSTNSDTECIVHLYEDLGLDFVKELRGMFAFAIWDERQRRLILVRDRLGIKPLFYAQHNNKLVFASEMKAILQDNNFPRDMNDNALAAYFTLSYIPAPLTIFKKIQKLLPGHILTVQNGQVNIQKYWDIEFEPDRLHSEDYFIEGFMELLQESINIHLISEVPLGAFLSGGIDSSTVVALMSKVINSPVNTVSIGFGGNTGGYLDERKYARKVVARYGTCHKEYEVLPAVQDLTETIVRAFDEPFADDSTIPSYFVCKAAKESVTVALSGLGGDEIFGGYERYLGFKLSRIYEKLPLFIREKWFRKLIEKLPERADGHYTINHIKRFVRSASLPADRRYLGYVSIMNNTTDFFAEPDRFCQPMQACQDMMLSYFNAPNARDDLNRVFYCDIKTYLPEDILSLTDRISMHHSLEVRVPFLDHKLVEFCATIPPEMKMKWFRKKYLLKKAVTNLLPREIINHRKQGFVGPMTSWLQKDLKSYILETLSEEKLKKHEIFNSKAVQRLLKEHFTGREIHDTVIWSLVIFQTWFDLYIESSEISKIV